MLIPLSLVDAEVVAAPEHSRQLTHLFDIKTAGSVELVLPTDVEVNQSRIYIVDSGNHRVVVLDQDGKHLFSFGRQGNGKGELQDPVGLGVANDNRIYVADSGNNRIQVFNDQGQSVGLIELRSGNVLIRPIDVAVDPETKNLYVTGNNNHKLMVYSQSGRKIREWGGNGAGPGKFRYPATVAVTMDSRIAVVDVLNTRVQLFQADGRFLVNVGEWGVLPGQLFRPKGVAIDHRGRVYISDSYMNLVQVFNDSGKFLYVLKPRGKRSDMLTPAGIAVAGNNRLYVTEMLKHRVSVFRLE
jgi:DNA-binding beta-propeller fold protein YncE